MKSPIPKSNRFSSFRFSLQSLRSPVSPLSPQLRQAPRFAQHDNAELSVAHSSNTTTVRGTPEPEKEPAVTVVDSDEIRALPTPGRSPITPWHATFHRHAATTDQETAYLDRTAYLRYARIGLSTLLLATAATLTALESDIIHRYNETHLSAEWHLSLWPTDLNLTSNLLALSTGGIITFLALITLAVAAIPSPNPRTKLNNALFSLLCFLATPLSLATLILSSVISPAAIFGSFVSNTLTSLVNTTGPSNTVGLTPNGQGGDPKRDTIQSFTCAVSNTAREFNKDAGVLELPSLSSSRDIIPSGFVRICNESKASLAIAICVLGLAAIGLIIAGWSWAVEKRIERLRGEREVIASRHGSRDGKVDGQNIPESLVGMPYEKQV